MSEVEFKAAPGELIPAAHMIAEVKGKRLFVYLTAPAIAPENWPLRVTHEGIDYLWVTRDICPPGRYGAAIYRTKERKPAIPAPQPSSEIVEVMFEVAGGKYDGDDINWKYIDSFPIFEEAKAKCDTLTYPIVELNVVFKYSDGRYQRTCAHSGIVRKSK